MVGVCVETVYDRKSNAWNVLGNYPYITASYIFPVQVQVGLLQALLPLARHIEIANKSSPLLNSLYFLSSCGYEAEFYRDRHTQTLLLYQGLRPTLMSPLRSGNKQRRNYIFPVLQ